MKKYILCLLAIVSLFAACRKNTDEITLSEKGLIQGEKVESVIYGKVLYSGSYPVENATVTIDGVNYKTNSRGEFWSKKQLFDTKGTLVRVSVAGSYDAFVFAFPRLNSETYIEIQMLGKQNVGTFQAPSNADITTWEGAKISIPENAIMRSDGSAYQGMVYVFAVWLDPTSKQTFRLMPGDLRAIDAAGDAKILKTYGMLGVELETPFGEKLNLMTGKTAKITFPVPTSIKNTAPATIPLWHFNPDNGYWVESGTATLVNGSYEAEVAHFSFWNCDIPQYAIKLSLKTVDAQGATASNLLVNVSSKNFGTRSGQTDADGWVGGLVPANEILNLTVLDLCGNEIYQINIGPFSADKDLGKIVVPTYNPPSISGILLDCAGVPVQQGIVTFSFGIDSVQTYTYTDINGHFSFVFPNCSQIDTFHLRGYDLQGLSSSPRLDVNSTGNSKDVGSIQACSPLEEYATFTCNGFQQTFILYPGFMLENGADKSVQVFGTGQPGSTIGGTDVIFSFNNLAIDQSSATLTDFHAISLEGDQLREYGCTYCPNSGCDCLATDANPIAFTSFANSIGEYISGTVSGNVRAQADQSMKPFTLDFKVKRKQ